MPLPKFQDGNTKIERISAVTKTGDGRNELSWYENGRKRSKTAKDKSKLISLRYELIGIQAENAGIDSFDHDFSDFDGTSAWWKRTIGQVTQASLKAYSDGDINALRKSEILARSLNLLAKSHSQYMQIADLENVLEDFVEYMYGCGHEDYITHIKDELGGKNSIAHTLQRSKTAPDDPLDC